MVFDSQNKFSLTKNRKRMMTREGKRGDAEREIKEGEGMTYFRNEEKDQ